MVTTSKTSDYIPKHKKIRVSGAVHFVTHRGPGGGWTECRIKFGWPHIGNLDDRYVVDGEKGEQCNDDEGATCLECMTLLEV